MIQSNGSSDIWGVNEYKAAKLNATVKAFEYENNRGNSSRLYGEGSEDKASEDLEPQAYKVGSFEWILSFETIAIFLDPCFTGTETSTSSSTACISTATSITSLALPESDFCTSEVLSSFFLHDVLVIGCGTSNLSHCIATLNQNNIACIKTSEDSCCSNNNSETYQKLSHLHFPSSVHAPLHKNTLQKLFPMDLDANSELPTPNPNRIFKARNVVSIDNDPGMIKHMQNLSISDAQLQNSSVYAPMHWLVYDIVTDEGALSATSSTTLNEVASMNIEQMSIPKQYDLIVDKGTFDAILTEGSISSMLVNLYRLLKPGGAYVLVSIRDPQLLYNLLNICPEMLQWDVVVYAVGRASDRTSTNPKASMPSDSTGNEQFQNGTVVICKKKIKQVSDSNIIKMSLEQLAEAEEEVMNAFYQHEHPLLTDRYERLIRHRYQMELNGRKYHNDNSEKQQHNKHEQLSLYTCHNIMFNPSYMPTHPGKQDVSENETSEALTDMIELGLGYTYDLFEEDWINFQQKRWKKRQATKWSDDGMHPSLNEEASENENLVKNMDLTASVDKCIAFLKEMQ